MRFDNKNVILPEPIDYSYIRMTAYNKGGIITDYFLNDNTSKIEIKFYDYSNVLTGDKWQYGFGIRYAFGSWNSGPSISAGANNNHHLLIFNDYFDRNSLPTINFTASETAIYTVDFKQNRFISNINGTTYNKSMSPTTWGTTTVPFGICCMWGPASSSMGSQYIYFKDGVALYKQADYNFMVKVAYCKIWEDDGQGNDILVRNFVPFKSDGLACMKDKVNGTICYSSEPSYTEVGRD